jgi:hypothetical protein
MEILIAIVLVLAIFALIAAIWGKGTAQRYFGSFASCITWIPALISAIVLVIIAKIWLSESGIHFDWSKIAGLGIIPALFWFVHYTMRNR